MAKLSIVSLLLSSFFIVSSLLPLAYSQTQNIRFYIINDNGEPVPPYGYVAAFQTILNVGPDNSSAVLGLAQGTIAYTTHDASFDLHLSVAFVFTSGRYNGSTIVAVGRNHVTESVREFPIVGGTGAFRLARGIVTATTYSIGPQFSVYEYDLEIIPDDIGSGTKMEYA